MRLWWRKEIEDARKRADEGVRLHHEAVERRERAEALDRRAQEVEDSLHQELIRNGFADALRAAFGGIQ